jgi:1-acyl-sn-glycerol-3-phosphate acyltransferase
VPESRLLDLDSDLTGTAIARTRQGYPLPGAARPAPEAGRSSAAGSRGAIASGRLAGSAAGRPGRSHPLEPWYATCKIVLLPPFKLWFNWRFEGLERVPDRGPLIVAGNHLSYLDQFAHAYFVIRAGRRPRFLAKAELFENPFLRTVLRGAGQIPVRRGTGDRAPLEEATRALQGGEIVVIYPEGTSVTDDPDFAPRRGKTGAVRLALATGTPILPVAIWGGQYVWRASGRESLRFARPIWLRAGEPIDVTARAGADPDRAAIRRLTDELMGELGTMVADLRAHYPRRWSQR